MMVLETIAKNVLNYWIIFLLWLTQFYRIARKETSMIFIYIIFRVRLAGIHGIQGFVRKMVRDQFLMEIHDSTMDKITPSLLFNICEKSVLF